MTSPTREFLAGAPGSLRYLRGLAADCRLASLVPDVPLMPTTDLRKRCPRCWAMVWGDIDSCPKCGLRMPTDAPPNLRTPTMPGDSQAKTLIETPQGLGALASRDTGSRYLIFVARNRLRLFQYLVEKFAHEGNI